MESDAFDLTEAQRTAERAEAAPYVDYPPTPGWYFPAFGAWVAAYVMLIGVDVHPALTTLGMVILAVLIGAYLGWYQSYVGAMPRLFGGPREFRHAYAWYFVGFAALTGLVAGVWVLLGHAAAVVTAFLVATAGIYAYERAYAAAARRTRERLA